MHASGYIRPSALVALLSSLLPVLPAAAGSGQPKPREIRVLVVRAEFPDRKMELGESEWKREWGTLQEKLADYWKRHSYGIIEDIPMECTGRLELPEASTNYFDVQELRKAMRRAAEKEGYRLSEYDQVVLSYPSIRHNISFGGLGTPGTVWLPGSNPFDGGYIHEFGHALGVGHANAVEGDGVPYPGEHREGRDGLFMMGSEGQGRVGDYSTINLPMRYRMGFVGDDHLERAKGRGVYRIYDFERERLAEKRTLGVRVEVEGKDFWITYAPAMADRWSRFNAEGFERGVLLHELRGSVTDILDFTPGSQGTGSTADFIDTRDGALQIGTSFAFPGTTVVVEPLKTGRTGNWRWIEVGIDTGK